MIMKVTISTFLASALLLCGSSDAGTLRGTSQKRKLWGFTPAPSSSVGGKAAPTQRLTSNQFLVALVSTTNDLLNNDDGACSLGTQVQQNSASSRECTNFFTQEQLDGVRSCDSFEITITDGNGSCDINEAANTIFVALNDGTYDDALGTVVDTFVELAELSPTDNPLEPNRTNPPVMEPTTAPVAPTNSPTIKPTNQATQANHPPFNVQASSAVGGKAAPTQRYTSNQFLLALVSKTNDVLDNGGSCSLGTQVQQNMASSSECRDSFTSEQLSGVKSCDAFEITITNSDGSCDVNQAANTIFAALNDGTYNDVLGTVVDAFVELDNGNSGGNNNGSDDDDDDNNNNNDNDNNNNGNDNGIINDKIGCCSYDYKTCAAWGNKSREACEALGPMVWLEHGPAANMFCMGRGMGCLYDQNSCCPGLVCDGSQWWKECKPE